NNGLLPQRKEWHARLRRLTREHGALLAVDEVITGFRLAWGGATEALGLDPDIVTLGKVLGGGMPVGAYGGRKDLMQLVAPLRPPAPRAPRRGRIPPAQRLRGVLPQHCAHARGARGDGRGVRARLPEAAMTPRERFLRAVAGQDVDRPPVWLMRQAGRYLPEYREIKGATTFEERVSRPEVAAELTLQPLRRFPLDAAVIFSDILVPLAGMGRPARFPGEGGPVVDRPVRTPEDVASLRAPDPARDMPFVMETIQRVRKSIPDHAVLGFAGAPFTLAAYLIEGGASKGFQETKQFCDH